MKIPRLLLLAAGLAVIAAAQTPAPRLGSTVFKWEELKARPTGNGERRDVTNRPTATIQVLESHITTLLPGRISHAPHQHDREEVIILRDGTLDVIINGTTSRAGPGSLLFYASNDFHNVKNVGDVPATYYVFNFTTAATGSAPKEGAAAAAVPGKLGSRVFEWAKLGLKPTKTGSRRAVVDSPTTTLENFECHVTTLKPGEAPHAAHHHPDEEIILIKEGTLTVSLPGGATTAGPGSVIFVSAGDEHGWRNIGETPATYYVMRLVTETTPPVAVKGAEEPGRSRQGP